MNINKQESVAFNPKAPGHIPGYTGYIRGADQLAGVRFGVKTQLACTKTVEDLMCDTAIPPKISGMLWRKLSKHSAGRISSHIDLDDGELGLQVESLLRDKDRLERQAGLRRGEARRRVSVQRIVAWRAANRGVQRFAGSGSFVARRS